MEQKLEIPAELLKMIDESDPEDRIIINVAVRNLGKQSFKDGSETAFTISESLYKRFKEKNLNDVIILKLEFPEYQTFDPLDNEEGFNNFLDIDFVKQLVCIQDDNEEDFILVGSTKNQEMDLTFTMEEEEEKIHPITQKYDNGPSQIQLFLIQMRKVYFQEQTIANMTKVIHQIPLTKEDQVLNVLLECHVRQIIQLNNFRFNLQNRSEPLFLNLKAARLLCDKIQKEEYSIKMGKMPVNISSFQVGILQQKEQKTEDVQSNININDNLIVQFEFQQYFDFDKFLDPQIKLQMYYHKENSKFQNQIELIINFFGKLLFKIQIDLTYCHYALMEEKAEQRVLYFKMLSPPIYQVSIMKERRYEMFNLKSDWTRIENLFLRMMVEKEKINEIQRLILINNSVIRIEIPTTNNDCDEFMINILMEKLNEYQLTKLGQEIEIEINDDNPHQFISKFDIDFKNLPFNCQYNILAAISQNKFNNRKTVKQLVYYLSKKQGEINNNNDFDKIQEHTFQQFNKMADNINLNINQSYVNLHNLSIFGKEFNRTREEIIITDYTNPKLAFIFRMSLTPSGLIYYHKMPEETSKVIRDYKNNLDQFIRLHFEDENQDSMHGITHISKYFYSNLMINGVKILDKKFNLLTWSASQLRTGSCWLLDAQISRVKVIDKIGDFTEKLKIEQTAKNAARLGQNFSSSTMFKFKNDINVQFIQDNFDNEGKLYTDGIGCISQDLIDELKKTFQIPFCNAIQIRYHGAKGVLVLKNGIPKNTIQLRQSMVKFNPSKMINGTYDNEISVLDYNKFRGGYLNRQIIILLQTLGISDEVFIQLQNEYLERIQDITIIDSSIYKHYNVEYNAETQGLTSIASILRDMVNSNLIDQNNQFISSILNRLKQRGLLQLRTKCNILVEKAARILGIIDEYNILQADEVYAFVGIDPAKPEMIDSEYVVITRNPCLHPGDIRKVRLIKDEEIKERNNGINPYFPNLVNCLIFPQAGSALTAQCGGGDLDGDVYFITWDERLIIKQSDSPMVYDEEKKENHTQYLAFQVDSSESYFQIPKMLEFMFQYLDSDVLGKIDNSHLAIADQSRDKAKDERCLQLAKLHAQAVDYVKHGQLVQVPPRLLAKQWPDYMEKSNKLLSYESQNVLGQLYRTIIQLSQNAIENNPIILMGYQCDILNDINTKLIYNYQDLILNDINDLNRQEQPLLSEEYANKIQQKIKDYVNQYAKPYFKCVIDCLSHIFETIDGLRKIYYIKNEYEIYSGYYTNFTKGEGTRLKVFIINTFLQKKLNVDNIQKRVIQHLVVLKNEVNKIIGKDHIYEKISLLYFILSYSPRSHNYSIETILGQFIWTLVKELQQEKTFSRLCVKYVHWYRGCAWFFFHKELLSMPQKTDQIGQQELDDDDQLI